jgi:hypothetical protein
MVSGHGNHPTLLGWQPVLESDVEGSVTLLENAFCHRRCCGGHRDRDHILAVGGSELSVDVHHCQPNPCCHWPMALLRFGLFLPDRSIGYHKRARPDGFRLLEPL